MGRGYVGDCRDDKIAELNKQSDELSAQHRNSQTNQKILTSASNNNSRKRNKKLSVRLKTYSDDPNSRSFAVKSNARQQKHLPNPRWGGLIKFRTTKEYRATSSGVPQKFRLRRNGLLHSQREIR